MSCPRWAEDAADKRRQQIAELRRRGFGLPAARDLADHIERIDRAAAARDLADHIERIDRVTAGDIGACAFIAAIILIGLPFCAILFVIGGK